MVAHDAEVVQFEAIFSLGPMDENLEDFLYFVRLQKELLSIRACNDM